MNTALAKLDYAIVAMTEQEALDWKKRVGSSANELRVILNEGYERGAWLALGFANWTDCIRAIANEFGFSERQIWYLHSANQIETNLLNHGSVGQIPERQLRPLAALEPGQQREAWKKAVETAPGGKITAAHVQSVAEDYKRPVSYHVSDDSYEWFTPAEYIEAARATMGDIDLDPASCKEANEVIKAKRFYTKQDSGLDHKWSGRVWINPPYNMPLIEDFANKAIESYKSGAIDQAIVLTNNSTDTGWFHALAEYPFCLTRGRIKFWQLGGEELVTRQGQAIFYLGRNIKKFAAKFSKFGIIVAQYEHCRP